MRHRLFHAVVLMGASLPACGSDEAAPVADSATASDTGSAAMDSTAADSAAGDSGAGDSASGDSTAVDSAKVDAPVDTCVDEGCGCFPCIK